MEAQGEVHEEVHEGAYAEGWKGQEVQETSFGVNEEEEHPDQHGEREMEAEGIEHGSKFEGGVEAGEKDKERAVEDFIGHPRWEQGRTEVVRTDAAATTEAPVPLLSQKHLFWFPSEAFQQEGDPLSSNPVTQTTQRSSGAQSEESKEQESNERHHHQHPVDFDDHDHDEDGDDDHDTDDHDNGQHDVHDDSLHDDVDDHDSQQEEDDRVDNVRHHVPTQREDLDERDHYENHDDHDDHYDMGEHEDDRVPYNQEVDDRDDTYDEHESYEDHKGVTDRDDQQEHPDRSEEHPDPDDHDDGEEHDDVDSHHDDHDDHEHDNHDDYDNHDDHDSHEDDDDDHQHVIFSIARDESQNVSEKGEGEEATTDDTWLDGYPVAAEETEKGDSMMERGRPDNKAKGTVVKATERPNEVEKPVPYTRVPEVPKSATAGAEAEHEGVEDLRPGFIATASPDNLEPSVSSSSSDTLDYDTQQAAPTHSWLGDLTEHPFLDHGPAPPMHDGDILTGTMEEHTVHNLPGEAGERDDLEGEMGETVCTGDNCPPSSSSRATTVAAIIAALCVVTAAVIIGVWCYRRQQQKSSLYEMNGKGQSQTRQAQQIEMQQKV